MALLSSAWVIPALVGPAVAGQVAEHASWRWVFIGILPAVAVGAWMLLPSLSQFSPMPVDEESRSAEAGHVRLLTALRLTAGVALALLAVGLNDLLPALVLAGVGLVLALP